MTRTVCRRQSGTTGGQGQCAGDNQVLQEDKDSVQETIRYYRRTGTVCRRQSGTTGGQYFRRTGIVCKRQSGTTGGQGQLTLTGDLDILVQMFID